MIQPAVGPSEQLVSPKRQIWFMLLRCSLLGGITGCPPDADIAPLIMNQRAAVQLIDHGVRESRKANPIRSKPRHTNPSIKPHAIALLRLVNPGRSRAIDGVSGL